MSVLELKNEVLQKISNADELLLKKIKSAIEEYEDNTIVAYTISGKPLTINQYREEVYKAEEDIKAGNYYTTEELRIKIESWKK